MPRTSRAPRSSRQAEKPEFGYNDILLFKSKPGQASAFTGLIKLNIEFIDAIVAAYDNDEIALDDDGRIILRHVIMAKRSKKDTQYFQGFIVFRDEEEEEEEEAPPSRSRRGRAAPEPAPRGRGRRAAPEPEDEEEDDEPPVTRGRRRRR